MKRIVVKVGSNVLTRDDGKLDVTRMSAIVDQIVWMKHNGFEVILVSSGAMACGRDELKINRKLDSVGQRHTQKTTSQSRLLVVGYKYQDEKRRYIRRGSISMHK